MDLYFFNLINQFAGRFFWLDKIGLFFADQFGYILIIFFFRIFWKKWRVIIQALSAVMLARLVIVNMIRWIFPRLRPFVENQVNLLIVHENTSSFPSGHAAFYFAIATVVFLYNKKIGPWFLGAAFLISFARVFSGVHWPSDILAGALVGIVSGWLVMKLSEKFTK
ncbi:MAG: phosphatase PAP2 family protein [bacterium]|nr:phosphatase PAP2 family protein [bacterium]